MSELTTIFDCNKESTSFLEAMQVLSEPFHNYYTDKHSIYEECILEDFCCEHEGFKAANGVSKVVLICPENSYALKTSFRGMAYYDDDKDDYLFTNANEDACETEYGVYKKAVERGLDKFFAEMLYVSDGVYMQEYCSDNIMECTDVQLESALDDLLYKYYENETLSDWADMHSNARNLDELYTYLDEEPLLFALFVSLYSEEDLYALQEFLEEYAINDLHMYNVGWCGGKLKFIDYCGFGTNTSEILASEKSDAK